MWFPQKQRRARPLSLRPTPACRPHHPQVSLLPAYASLLRRRIVCPTNDLLARVFRRSWTATLQPFLKKKRFDRFPSSALHMSGAPCLSRYIFVRNHAARRWFSRETSLVLLGQSMHLGLNHGPGNKKSINQKSGGLDATRG